MGKNILRIDFLARGVNPIINIVLLTYSINVFGFDSRSILSEVLKISFICSAFLPPVPLLLKKELSRQSYVYIFASSLLIITCILSPFSQSLCLSLIITLYAYCESFVLMYLLSQRNNHWYSTYLRVGVGFKLLFGLAFILHWFFMENKLSLLSSYLAYYWFSSIAPVSFAIFTVYTKSSLFSFGRIRTLFRELAISLFRSPFVNLSSSSSSLFASTLMATGNTVFLESVTEVSYRAGNIVGSFLISLTRQLYFEESFGLVRLIQKFIMYFFLVLSILLSMIFGLDESLGILVLSIVCPLIILPVLNTSMGLSNLDVDTKVLPFVTVVISLISLALNFSSIFLLPILPICLGVSKSFKSSFT